MINQPRPRPASDAGFSLVELMVVVVIIAILLAIAIPAFLAERNTANSRVPESDLHAALTAEQSQWTSAQTFQDAAAMQALEGSLAWTSTAPSPGNLVSVALGDKVGSSYNAVSLGAAGHDGNCYTALVSNDPNQAFTAYNVSPAGGSGCPIPAVPSPLPSVQAGSASGAGHLGTTNFYSTW